MADLENPPHLAPVTRGTRGSVALQNFSRSPQRKNEFETYVKQFKGLPLGIDVESAISQKNLFVKKSSDPNIEVGSQIVMVNNTSVIDMDAPQIVQLIQECTPPFDMTFRSKPKLKRPSIKSPRSTARIEFADGQTQLIPMNDMTVKDVTDFIWNTGDFFGEKDHYGMFVIDMQDSELSMIPGNSLRTVSEEVLDISEDLASKRYEFRVKDDFENYYRDVDVDRFRGPWLTLDNERVTFHIIDGVAEFEMGKTCQLTWKGPNVVEIEHVFKKMCEVNEEGQIAFRSGEIWVPHNANFLSVKSRVRQVSQAQVLIDVNVHSDPHGLAFKVADTGEQVVVARIEDSSPCVDEIQAGDVVVSLNNRSYGDADELMRELQNVVVPFTLQLSRLRGGSSVGLHPDEVSSLPQFSQGFNGFLRIFVDSIGQFTVPVEINTTVSDIRAFLTQERGVSIPSSWQLYVTGTQDLRTFRQVLDETNNPMEIRDSITRDGQYSVKFQFAATLGEDDDSDSDSDYSSDLEEAVPEAPAYAQRSSIDDWADEEDVHVNTKEEDDMVAALRRMQQANPDLSGHLSSKYSQVDPGMLGGAREGEMDHAFGNTPMGQQFPPDPAVVKERIALVEEAVRKQWLIAEALHDFDKDSIPNWPDYSTLQSLEQGDMLLVSKRDPTGWWKGKNIMGGHYEKSPDGAYFPGSYVEVVAKPLYLARTTHPFDPNSVDGFPTDMVLLPLNPGDILIVTNTHESGWWRGCNLLGGAEGYFPKDFVEITAQPDQVLDQWSNVFPNLKMKGLLDKKTKFTRKWKTYFFVYEGDLLKYYDSDTSDPREPDGQIRIADASYRANIIADADQIRKFTIQALKKEWHVRSHTPEMRQQWMEALSRGL